jgi:hypothetical protein
VCKLCEFYSIAVAKHCRETIAEEVKDKQRANFCDYFKPQAGAFSSVGTDAATRAKTELEALFGARSSASLQPTAEERARVELEKLFGKKS